MSDNFPGYQTQKMVTALSKANHQLHIIGHKLLSFAFLLERQSDEHEGPVELQGLGYSLRDLADEASSLGIDLDPANYVQSKLTPRK